MEFDETSAYNIEHFNINCMFSDQQYLGLTETAEI